MTRSSARDWLPALIVFVAVLVAWELSLLVLGVQSFLIPRPSVIASSLADDWSTLAKGIVFTGAEAIGGLIVGVILGTVCGIATARWASAREILLRSRSVRARSRSSRSPRSRSTGSGRRASCRG